VGAGVGVGVGVGAGVGVGVVTGVGVGVATGVGVGVEPGVGVGVVRGVGLGVRAGVGVGEKIGGRVGNTGYDGAGVGFAALVPAVALGLALALLRLLPDAEGAALFVPDGTNALGCCVPPGNHRASGFSRWALLTSEKGCTSTIAIRKLRPTAMTIRKRLTRV
jgi:hypothetical protein